MKIHILPKTDAAIRGASAENGKTLGAVVDKAFVRRFGRANRRAAR